MAAFVELVAARRAIIELIGDLQNRIVAALDETERGTARTSMRTRSRKVASPIAGEPCRYYVWRKLINDNLDAELSQSDIAIQFTKGDEKLAKTLMRADCAAMPGLLSKREK